MPGHRGFFTNGVGTCTPVLTAVPLGIEYNPLLILFKIKQALGPPINFQLRGGPRHFSLSSVKSPSNFFYEKQKIFLYLRFCSVKKFGHLYLPNSYWAYYTNTSDKSCYTKEGKIISKTHSNKLNQMQQKKLGSTLYSTQKVL